MPDYRVLNAGDTAIVVEFGESIDRRLSTWVLALARRLNETRLEGIVETVPTFRSLLVHYDPLILPTASLTAHIAELMRGLQVTRAGRPLVAPAGLLRSRSRPRSRRCGGADRPVAGASDRAAQRRDLPCLHARLPARPSLYGRCAGRARSGAAGISSAEDTGRVARDRERDDLHFPDGNAMRMASHRPIAGRAVGRGPASARAARAGRQGELRAGFACANTSACRPRRPTGRSRSSHWTRPSRPPHEPGAARPRTRAADDRPGSRPRRLPKPRNPRERRARSYRVARRQCARRQQPGRWGSRGRLCGADARGRGRRCAAVLRRGPGDDRYSSRRGRDDRHTYRDHAQHSRSARRGRAHRLALRRRRALRGGGGRLRHPARARQRFDLPSRRLRRLAGTCAGGGRPAPAPPIGGIRAR